MKRRDENNENAFGPSGFTGIPRGGKSAHRASSNRVALRDIKNVVPVPVAYNKRGVLGNNVVEDNKIVVPFASKPPTTRSLAATSKAQSALEDFDTGLALHGKLDQAASNSDLLSATTSVDVDDYKSLEDVLMEEEDEETGDMEVQEVEMVDISLDQIDDIDTWDHDNPLAAVDYVDDIYRYYRKVEDMGRVSPDYMSNQYDINEKTRAILIDWLIEVHCKFELMDETLYLTVNILDRFLAQQEVKRKKLQLVGVTAMLLACKYEEVAVPVVDDFIHISDDGYTRDEVLDMEKSIANTLQFDMSAPTPYVFMRRFLKAANSNNKLEHLSFFLIELCLVEYEMLKYRPSLLAAAAVYTAQSTLMGFIYWTSTHEFYTRYTQEQLIECSRMMVEFHQKAASGKLAVHRKYSTCSYGLAASCKPGLFLLDA